MFLIGSFIALPAFRNEYGIPDGSGGRVIETSWQSALQVGGPLGALIGVFLAGPLAAWIGYRWATIAGLMALNATIFIMFFANSLPVFFASQLLEGEQTSNTSVSDLADVARYPLGRLHRSLSCVLLRNRAHASACTCYTSPAALLGCRRHHRRWCLLRL